ncbi:uncharacterized protein PHACADRAFT_135187 [Phanerochaete carnosa HHB-10118-sp]|uniref:Uncharacterized protein n=1 Tax=Phanerochaete carnosa (strain HHB-10118-sp) TaxID=650164 RepID=K5VEN4_PHACS|nr:uncharacterized protein PHACADRAFT_135187 [Phanerochaete carnosa HHB-10118-sp]EKM61486.1 hypothetical protein PHACADRAFT_135187 [Phanerochaete carnosa HHB-10118-sp]
MDVDSKPPPLSPPPTYGFCARQGTHDFEDPEQGGRRYLPQVNKWGRGAVEWRCERAGGAEHVPLWEAYPIWRDEPLLMFNAQGPSKQAAKEASARLMAESGHC